MKQQVRVEIASGGLWSWGLDPGVRGGGDFL